MSGCYRHTRLSGSPDSRQFQLINRKITTPCAKHCFNVSPDSNWITYLRSGELVTCSRHHADTTRSRRRSTSRQRAVYGGWIVPMQGLPGEGEGATSPSVTAWPCGFLNGSEWDSRWDTGGDFTASALKERVSTATWRRRMLELLTKYTPETHVVTKVRRHTQNFLRWKMQHVRIGRQ